MPPNDDVPKKKRSTKLILFTVAVLLIGLAWFCYWFFYLRYHESTDDAFANGNLITINSAVPGSVVAFYADDTDYVEEGELLVLLDKTPYEIAYEKELAALGSIALQVRELYDSIPIKEANVENKRTLSNKALYDYENRSKLVGTEAISNEDFTHAKDAYATAKEEQRIAEFELVSALDAVGNTPPENHPRIEQQKAKVITAFYNLFHTKIYAPASGYVAERAVQVGEYANPGKALMAVIPTTYVWVDANFKETQLSKMRIGQKATVWFDLYGSSIKFNGEVLGIASGTGSVFSIIPPQNATGNWIKIVQRLPVRISLDKETLEKYPMRIGISANVDVSVADQDLPMLARAPKEKAVAATRVFDIDLKEVAARIKAIIDDNLK